MSTLRLSCINAIPGGRIKLPASKSLSNRALIIRALSGKEITLNNLSLADDSSLLDTLLKSISKRKAGKHETILHCKNAGTVFRFLTAFLAVTPGDWLLTGSQRMKERPVHELVEGLKELGASIQYMEQTGYPPLAISGRNITGGTLSINAAISSQFISALLMIAPTLEKGLLLELSGTIGSRPYIHMTLDVLSHFGIQSRFAGSTISIAPQAFISRSFSIEPDWSSAAFWYELVALAKNAAIFLEGLSKESLQGDAVLPDIFEPLGVATTFSKEGIQLVKKEIQGGPVDYNFTDNPDLAQAVIATCAGLGLEGRFTGLASLRIKETDRLNALKTELAKLGVEIELKSAGELVLLANSKLRTPAVVAFNPSDDHRMAMALAPLALVVSTVDICDSQAVSKSYPHFWDDLQKVGFKISET